jgi:hypothetical protein
MMIIMTLILPSMRDHNFSVPRGVRTDRAYSNPWRGGAWRVRHVGLRRAGCLRECAPVEAGQARSFGCIGLAAVVTETTRLE